MKRSITIGNWEAVLLLLNAICAKIYLGFPRDTAQAAGTAGWIMTLYISTLAFVGFMIIYRLFRPFEGKDLLDIGEYAGGKAGRIIVGIFLLIFLLFIVPTVLRIFSEDMKIISLPNSPISFVTLFFFVGMIASAYFGIETIARLSAIIVAGIATGFIIILIAVSPFFDINNILPILGNGSESILVKGSFKVSYFSELAYLFLLIPFLRTHENFRKVGKWAVLLSGFFFVIGSLTFLMAFPYPMALERVLPVYQMTRLINFGRFFQRVESFFVVAWAASGLMYASTGFFFLVYVFKKTFKLEFHRPLILPLGVIVFVLSLLPANLLTAVRLEGNVFREWSWVIAFGLPILLLLVARLKKKNLAEKK